VAVSALKYRAAVGPLTRVTSDAAASEAEVVEAYALLAKTQLALQKPDLAQAAYEGLLRRAPMAADPEGSPALRAAFQKAKAALFPPRTVRLTRKASGSDTLVVEVVNPWRIALTVSWLALDGPPRALSLDEDRVVTALAPGSAGWLELTSEGQVVAALGSRAEPIVGPPAQVSDVPKKDVVLVPEPTKVEPTVLPPPPPPEGVPTRRVVGWTLVGVGAAATIAGGITLGTGAADKDFAARWPLNGLSLTDNNALETSAGARVVAGPIVGGVGLAALIGGVVVLLTE
jgi:hypothetical protein